MRSTVLLLKVLSFTGLCTAQLHQAVLTAHDNTSQNRAVNVAIIGAGAAGSSAAYHLSRFAAEVDVPINLTVFERETYVGGRSTTVNAYNDPNYPIELGASIFVKVNHILVDAAQTFNLTTSALDDSRTARADAPSLGIWDGKKFVVTLSPSGATWWDTAKFLYRYGLAPIRTMNLMKATVGKFLTMYDKPVFPFASLTDAAREVELLDVTSTPGIKYLVENGISASFAHDIIQASTRVNYAQNLEDFHGLETMVCMATDGAMAIEGGNWQIFNHFISASTAKLFLNTTVNSITTEHDGSYTVETMKDTQVARHRFDAVIIAAPFQYSKIQLSDDINSPQPVDYVNLHVTLFTSPLLLSPAFFHSRSNEPMPRTVLTTLLCDTTPETCFSVNGTAPNFFSISLLTALENPATGLTEYAYKVFSHTAPTDAWLLSLLGADSNNVAQPVTWIDRKLWHSYPLETPRRSFEDIELHDKLWYTAGMDSFISTMETNALMGKNVAKLLVDKLESSIDTQRRRVKSGQAVLA